MKQAYSQRQGEGKYSSRWPLYRGVISRLAGLLVVTYLLLFLPAGTWRYPHAWAYLAVLCLPMLLVVGYFLKYDQKFLASRMQMKEKETTQKWVVAVSFLLFILGFLVPGLDFRFGWSKVPAWQVVSADVLVLASYFYCFLVFRENSFASRIVEVKKGQKVISTGPYSHVRHPMYTAITVMYMVTPLALGSYWGMIPMLSIPALLIVRLLNEEKVLRKKLPGYSGYCRKVRYRLIPGVW